jgi:hypothetical protein
MFFALSDPTRRGILERLDADRRRSASWPAVRAHSHEPEREIRAGDHGWPGVVFDEFTGQAG